MEYPLRAQIWDNGAEDFSDIDNNNYDDSGGLDSGLPAMIERPGSRVSEDEVADLHDLLGQMLRYQSESRVAVDEVLEHRWFRGIY